MKCTEPYQFNSYSLGHRKYIHFDRFYDRDGHRIRTSHITPKVIDHCYACGKKIKLGEHVIHRKLRKWSPIYHAECARRLNII